MSRFFAGTSSEEESHSESDNSDKDNNNNNVTSKPPAKFAKAASSGSSGDEKRVVRTAKDKRFDELQQTVTKIKNSVRINDWVTIAEEFDKLGKQVQKAAAVIQKEGVPPFFISCLVQLEEAIKNTTENKAKLKMNGTNAKSFNAMRQRLKKFNKDYETKIEEYRKSKGADDNEEAEEEGEESTDEDEKPAAKPVKAPPVKQSAKPKAPVDDEKDSTSEDSDFPSSSEEESSSEEDSGDEGGRGKWFVKPGKKTTPAAKPAETEKPDTNANPATTKKPGKPTAAPATPPVEEKKEEKPKELTEKEIRTKLLEILKERGKRGTEPAKQVEKLVELYQYAKVAPLQVEILAHLASAQFDMSPGSSTSNRNAVSWWRTAHENLVKILNLIDANPGVYLKEADEGTTVDTLAEDHEGFFVGTLVGFLERLDEELTKTLLSIEALTSEYIARLADEQLLLEFAERVQHYYEKHPQNRFKLAARVAMVRVKHLYYRYDAKFVPNEDCHRNNAMQLDSWLNLDKLCHFVYQHGDERLKAHAVLCQVYYQALHDRFFEAREKLLMSHLPDNVVHMDIPTQILYNRATIQLGLCAFRIGLVKKAHKCLSELCSGGRIRELIAQGIATRFQDQKTQEQEKAEKKRQYPHHMHIQLDLVEAVHLITAMLLEVPNMAAGPAYDGKKKIFSKTFHRYVDNYERQVFMGPPENNREVIVLSAKHLGSGDWRRCAELVLGLPVWSLLPANSVERIKNMLHSRIQEEGLRTYLLTYCDVYESISMEQLTKTFDLSKTAVYTIAAKMIVSQQLHAMWDESMTLVMHRVEPSKLQYLALQLAEKATQFVENNERILDSKNGSYGYKTGEQQSKGREGGMGMGGDRKDGRSGKGGMGFKPTDRRKGKPQQKRTGGGLNAAREQYERESGFN